MCVCVCVCVCVSARTHACVCVSTLPDVFWTVTLNESKYSIILEGLRKQKMML